MRRFKIALTAGVDYDMAINGDYFRVIAGVAEFEVQPDTSQRLSGLQSGMAYTTPKKFRNLRIRSDVNQNIEIMAGMGRVDDNRSSISGVVDTASRGATLQNSAVTVGTTAAQIATANAAVRGHIILNNSAGDIFIGNDATVTTLTGFKITAGQTLTIDKAPQATIYAIGSAAGLDVRILSEFN